MGKKKKKGRSRKPPLRLRLRAPRGAAPGTLVIDPEAPKPRIRVFAYGPERFVEKEVARPEDLREFLGQWPVVWINVDGLGDESILRELARMFVIHRLAIEDVVNVNQRPKVEQYDENQYIVMRMVHLDERLDTEQLSLFLGEGFLLTFQERVGDSFDPVRERIRNGRGRLRHVGADYLAYALMDAIIDGYYPVLEQYGERIEALENEVLDRPQSSIVPRIHDLKRDLLALRRAVWPARETVNTIIREDTPFFTDETRVYLRDCYDHMVQVLDMVETYRELGSGLMDLYMSSIGNRMNEIMKVLTIFAAIFIPLSFIAGLYGMNFDPALPGNMPELGLPYGYVGALALMALTAGGLLLFFRHRGWIGGDRPRSNRHDAGPDAPDDRR